MRSTDTLRWLAVAALLGCQQGPQRRPAVVTVSISVVPVDGGSAAFEVHRDGTTKGYHLSGDSPPFVHQDEGRLDSSAVDSLWTLVAAVDSLSANQSPPSGRGYAALQLTFGEGVAWLTSWPDSAQSGDPNVRAAATWLLAHRIGGW